jgi:hypothetical protein
MLLCLKKIDAETAETEILEETLHYFASRRDLNNMGNLILQHRF